MNESKVLINEIESKRRQILSENERLEILAKDRLKEIERWTNINYKLMFRVALAYCELDRQCKFNNIIPAEAVEQEEVEVEDEEGDETSN